MSQSRVWIAKNIGFPLQKIIKKTSIIKKLDFLKESQFWDEDKIHEYQLTKLKSIIDYSAKNVPYYEQLFKKIKLNSDDIKSIKDINKIPILTKEILQKEGSNMVSRMINPKLVKKGKTGGTTGVPTIYYKDTNNRSFTWASYYRWYEWMGLNYYDPVATFWGAKTVLSTSLKSKIKSDFTSFIQNNIILNSFNINEEMANSYYKTISKLRPYLIKGYMSSMLDFAKFVEKNKWEFCELKAISTTTENLLPNNREYLERVFKVPVFDQYGCGEISAISYECSKHNGLHINQEHVICEILDNDNNPILNQSGRVITTDLDNYVMPFVRYENGDMATLTDRKCTCGVNQPLMESIDGRSIDTITLNNGSKVHGVFFTDILFEIGILSDEFRKFQIVQNKIDSIEFRLETQKPLDPRKKEKLLISLKRFIDNVKYIEVDKIEKQPNGKFKYIINNTI
tara:strand:- start:6436 stop:7797 length:1362 start_codon:yes stop_codon:yes gene_type:complete